MNMDHGDDDRRSEENQRRKTKNKKKGEVRGNPPGFWVPSKPGKAFEVLGLHGQGLGQYLQGAAQHGAELLNGVAAASPQSREARGSAAAGRGLVDLFWGVRGGVPVLKQAKRAPPKQDIPLYIYIYMCLSLSLCLSLSFFRDGTWFRWN